MSRFSDLFIDKTSEDQKVQEVKVEPISQVKEVKPTPKKKGRKK